MILIEAAEHLEPRHDFLAGYRIFPFTKINADGELELAVGTIFEEVRTRRDAAELGRYVADLLNAIPPDAVSENTYKLFGIDSEERFEQYGPRLLIILAGKAFMEIRKQFRNSNDLLKAFDFEYASRTQFIESWGELRVSYLAEGAQIQQIYHGRENFAPLADYDYGPLRPPGTIPERDRNGHLIWYDDYGISYPDVENNQEAMSRGLRLRFVEDAESRYSPVAEDHFLEYVHVAVPRAFGNPHERPRPGRQAIDPPNPSGVDEPHEGPSPFRLHDDDGGFVPGARLDAAPEPRAALIDPLSEGRDRIGPRWQKESAPPWDTTPVNPDAPWFPSRNPARLLRWADWEQWTGPERSAAPAWVLAAHLGMRGDYGWSAIEPWFRSVLEQNGVGEPAWQTIRKAAWLAESGISYVTPDAIEALPDDALEPLTDKRIGEGSDGASRLEAARIARRDLAVSVRRLLSEEGARQMKVLEPGEPLSEMPPMRYAVPTEGAMGDETAASFLDRFADDLEPDPWHDPAEDGPASEIEADPWRGPAAVPDEIGRGDEPILGSEFVPRPRTPKGPSAKSKPSATAP